MDGQVDASRRCDGFTTAVGFTAVPAALAGIEVAPPPEPSTVCTGDNDPALDDCELE